MQDPDITYYVCLNPSCAQTKIFTSVTQHMRQSPCAVTTLEEYYLTLIQDNILFADQQMKIEIFKKEKALSQLQQQVEEDSEYSSTNSHLFRTVRDFARFTSIIKQKDYARVTNYSKLINYYQNLTSESLT